MRLKTAISYNDELTITDLLHGSQVYIKAMGLYLKILYPNWSVSRCIVDIAENELNIDIRDSKLGRMLREYNNAN